MQRKGPLSGKIFAWCILQRRFAGHFEYMESISCQNQLILDAWRRYLATKGRFYRLRLLRECIRAIFCQECGSSSDRSALRRRFVQRARLRLSEMSLENVSSRNVALRLSRRTKGGYCGVLPTSVYRFGAVGLWAMRRCGASGTGCRR